MNVTTFYKNIFHENAFSETQMYVFPKYLLKVKSSFKSGENSTCKDNVEKYHIMSTMFISNCTVFN